MLTAVKLVDQWDALERRLPADWATVALRLRPEQPTELDEAARILGPMNVGRTGDELAFALRRAGGAASPQAARRLFGRLDAARIWCVLDRTEITEAEPAAAAAAATTAGTSVTATWLAAIEELPAGWSDLLCLLEIESSALLPRAALLCAPINPTRDRDRVGFTFRCARRAGYGASPAMVRRCFERLDEERIAGAASVLHVLSDADNAATQGVVWYVGGRAL